MATEEKSCGCVIFSKNGDSVEVLLTQNKRGLHWSFPKGHVERGESEIQTAVREVREETGLAVSPFPDFTISNKYVTSRSSTKTVVYFVAECERSAPLTLQESEVKAARWLPVAEARTALTYDNDVKILSDASQYYARKANAGKL